MLSRVQAILAGIVAIVGIILAAFLKGRSSGKEEVKTEVAQEKVKETVAVAEQKVVNQKVKADVQKVVISSSDKSVDDELLNDWTRPDSGK